MSLKFLAQVLLVPLLVRAQVAPSGSAITYDTASSNSPSAGNGSSPSTIAIAVVGAVLGAVLIVVAVYKVMQRRRRLNSEADGCTPRAPSASALPLFLLSQDSVLSVSSLAAQDLNADTISFTSSHRHSVNLSGIKLIPAGPPSPATAPSRSDEHPQQDACPLDSTSPVLSISISVMDDDDTPPALAPAPAMAFDHKTSSAPSVQELQSTSPERPGIASSSTIATGATTPLSTVRLPSFHQPQALSTEVEQPRLSRPPPAYAFSQPGRGRSRSSSLSQSSVPRSQACRSSEDLLKRKIREYEAKQVRGLHGSNGTQSPTSRRPPSLDYSALTRPSSLVDVQPTADGTARQGSLRDKVRSQIGKEYEERFSRILDSDTSSVSSYSSYQYQRKAASYHGRGSSKLLNPSHEDASSSDSKLAQDASGVATVTTRRPSLVSQHSTAPEALPKNVVRYVPKSSFAAKVEDCAWFHNAVSRKDAEDILRAHGACDGLFIVRNSPTASGELVLSVCYAGGIFHNPLKITPSGVKNTYSTTFSSLSDCLDAYSTPTSGVAGSLDIQTPLTCYPVQSGATELVSTSSAPLLRVAEMPPFTPGPAFQP